MASCRRQNANSGGPSKEKSSLAFLIIVSNPGLDITRLLENLSFIYSHATMLFQWASKDFGHRFRWASKNGRKLSRIDRILVCSSFINCWSEACYYALSRHLADHSPLILSMTSQDFGPIPFRFFNSWMSRPGFDTMIKKANDDFSFDGPPELALQAKLKNFKAAIIKWIKDIKAQEEELNDTIFMEMDQLDKIMEERFLTEDEEWILGECKHNLSVLETHNLKDLWQKSRAKWASHGDDNTKYFHGIINGKNSRNRIHGVDIEGVWGSHITWNWRWQRLLTTHNELQQFQAIKDNIVHIHVSNNDDSWTWTKDPSGIFTVASMRRSLQQPTTSNSFSLQWNSWVPLKANIYGWRAEKERIATKQSLSVCGIPLSSTLCP
ncbi:hypothetical protein QVD17_16319 [Tagetes erecta]|uniref:Uncharacterized protein n=1 Tax=Tagetes erecta TaxID=13708 RepID=A0AAD8KU15_TARER|nr:hypothetical protein QVD17_16319 [Tagetes erecta]